jgi:hypothetical protein
MKFDHPIGQSIPLLLRFREGSVPNANDIAGEMLLTQDKIGPMSNLAVCANKWNEKKCECKVIIETPK